MLVPPTVPQVTVTKPLVDDGDCGVQVGTPVFVTVVLQVVCWYPFVDVGASAVQLATGVGPLITVGAGHVVTV